MSNDCEYVLKICITVCMAYNLSTEIQYIIVNKWITSYILHNFLKLVLGNNL